MIDCSRDDIRDLLPDLVHDQLEPAERARVEQHLVECAGCAAELEVLRSMRASAFVTPAVDVDRIAAAVRASMAGSSASSGRSDEAGDVVSIDEARRRLGSSASAVRSGPAPRLGRTRATGSGIPQSWRIAAAIALVAAGAGGYALSTGGTASFQRRAGQADAAASEQVAGAAAGMAAPTAGAAKTSGAAPAPPAPMMAADANEAASRDAGTEALVPEPVILGDALNGLSESDMQELLQSVDDLEAMPDLEPHQLPLLASVVEGAL